MPDNDQLSDIPSAKEVKQLMTGAMILKRTMPIWLPILRLLGADVSQIEKGFESLVALHETSKELIEIPDRFNSMFVEQGWILYELMNLETAKTALEMAEAGDMIRAEQVLVDYYSPEEVERKLSLMQGISVFRPRMRLAHLALEDYRAERYHACVPVVLALIDGLVNDLHPQHRGFFTSEADLTAWDSMTAHNKGLNKLNTVFSRSRQKTRTDEISIPYRNGIVHGTDLGYDNRVVAAKTWAALFAVRDWAVKAIKGELIAPPEEPKESLIDILKKLSRTEEFKKRIDEWKPRSIVVGQDIPSTGAPEAYEEGTPEKKLAEFLSYLAKRNYGYMAKCLPKMFLDEPRRMPKVIREHYESRNLKSFEFVSVNDSSAFITEITVRLTYDIEESTREKDVVFRLMSEDSTGDLDVITNPDAEWKIGNWGAF